MTDEIKTAKRRRPATAKPARRTILGHSWRELSYEVMVVVLGVALALIGQQIVDEINWQY